MVHGPSDVALDCNIMQVQGQGRYIVSMMKIVHNGKTSDDFLVSGAKP